MPSIFGVESDDDDEHPAAAKRAQARAMPSEIIANFFMGLSWSVTDKCVK
jgi:hypothetical protein